MSTWIIRPDQPGSGLRVAVKDIIDVAGLPTTAGSRALADRARPAAADAACLAGLRAAMARGDARLAGKVNLHELAYGITGINDAFGTPVNPLDPALVPGGSSSGSAVAVATGEADVAYGSDTGGSIRIPAACCGVAGLKTTWGRIPLTGVWPLAPSLDTVGPMARDVAGLAAGMALLEPGFTPDQAPPAVAGRVALDADPAMSQAVDRALAAAGWQVTPVTLDGLAAARAALADLLDGEAWASNAGLVSATPDLIGPDVLRRLREAAAVTRPRPPQPVWRRPGGAPVWCRCSNTWRCSRSRRSPGSPRPWTTPRRWAGSGASIPSSTWPACPHSRCRSRPAPAACRPASSSPGRPAVRNGCSPPGRSWKRRPAAEGP